MRLSDFAIKQEVAVNEAAGKAKRMLGLNPAWNMESWFEGLKVRNPLFKGVGIGEFGAAVLGTEKFSNLDENRL